MGAGPLRPAAHQRSSRGGCPAACPRRGFLGVCRRRGSARSLRAGAAPAPAAGSGHVAALRAGAAGRHRRLSDECAPAMVFLVIVMPILLLGAMLGMHGVEQWLDKEPAEPRRVRADQIPVPGTVLVSPRRA